MGHAFDVGPTRATCVGLFNDGAMNMAVNRFLDTALSISKPDWTVGQAKELAHMFQRFYNIGIDEAASKAESWAEESCGGSGSGGEGYLNLAKSIRSLSEQ